MKCGRGWTCGPAFAAALVLAAAAGVAQTARENAGTGLLVRGSSAGSTSGPYRGAIRGDAERSGALREVC
jgi:hypothetical protein